MTTKIWPKKFNAARKAASLEARFPQTRFFVVPAEGGHVIECDLSPEFASDAPALRDQGVRVNDLKPRFGTSSPALVNDLPPGFKRLRAAKEADEIRAATLADQEAGRAEAAAKIAASKAPAAPAPKPAAKPVLFEAAQNFLKPAAGRKARAEAVAKLVKPEAAKADKPAKPAKPAAPISKDGYDLPTSGARFGAIYEAALAGNLPEPPDFSALTHAGYRKRLAEAVALAEAGDAKGLRDFPISPVSASRKAVWRYAQYAATAIEARDAAKKAA